MKNYIRVFCLILAVMCVIPLIASCTENKPEDKKTEATIGESEPADSKKPDNSETSAVTDKVTETQKYEIGDNVPEELKFQGQTINILSRDSDWVNDEITVNGYAGSVSDAIYDRQIAIETRLGIEINNQMLTGSNYVISDRIRNDVSKTHEADYDIIANSCYSTIMYTGEGIMRDLNDCEYLDLTRPYWSQGFNQAASIGDAQYMCTGAAALTLFRYMFVTMFNKELVSSTSKVNLYDVVNGGDWTIQYQLDMCQDYSNDVNTTLGADGTYGFVTNELAYIDPYWSSCELTILSKTNDNWLEYNLNIEKLSSTVDLLLQLFDDKNLGTYCYKSVSDSQNQINVASHFASDRAATATLRLASVESAEIRNMKSIYGIIPMPKFNKAQKEYHTFLHDQFTAFGVCSLVAAERLPLIGAFLEVFASKSYEIVMPAYYELALKNRYLQDQESADMLDMIYNNIYIDAGVLYNKMIMLDGSNGIHQALRSIIRTNKTNTVSSRYGASGVTVVITRQLSTLQTAIEKYQNS